MRLLLDTQVLIWARSMSGRLRPTAAAAIVDAEERVVSVATAWEIGIKVALGRLSIAETPRAMIEALLASTLPIGLDHVECAAALPPHHADPFDRLLVAQAQSEGLVLVTADAAMLAYDCAILRA